MFVPLPVPFVFQRTAPDLNAWRLKSPLALRSNSGKTFFFLFSLRHTSSMSARLGHADPPRLARCRCTCSGQSCRRARTDTHAHRDTLLRLLLQASTDSFTLAGRLVELKKKRTLSSALEIPKYLKSLCVNFFLPMSPSIPWVQRSTRPLGNFQRRVCLFLRAFFSPVSVPVLPLSSAACA